MKKLSLTALALLAGFSASALAAEELRFGVAHINIKSLK